MIHARADYDAIQPFPTKRPHHVRVNGQLVLEHDLLLGVHMDPIIPDDEPVFLVRGQDRAAIATMEAWCVAAEAEGAEPEILDTVRRHIELVREWQQTTLAKIPDAPEHVLR